MSDKPTSPKRFYIAPAKILHYLLDADHPEGGGKCKFLAQFGFTPENAGVLAAALDMHRDKANYVGTVRGYEAYKVYFDGPLISPGMDNPSVRTVWQLDDADETRTARFITLVPRPKLPVKDKP